MYIYGYRIFQIDFHKNIKAQTDNRQNEYNEYIFHKFTYTEPISYLSVW